MDFLGNALDGNLASDASFAIKNNWPAAIQPREVGQDGGEGNEFPPDVIGIVFLRLSYVYELEFLALFLPFQQGFVAQFFHRLLY